jgi:hypothetical protein
MQKKILSFAVVGLFSIFTEPCFGDKCIDENDFFTQVDILSLKSDDIKKEVKEIKKDVRDIKKMLTKLSQQNKKK